MMTYQAKNNGVEPDLGRALLTSTWQSNNKVTIRAKPRWHALVKILRKNGLAKQDERFESILSTIFACPLFTAQASFVST